MSKQENFGIFLLDVKLEFHKLLSRVFVFLNDEIVLKQRQLFLKGGLIMVIELSGEQFGLKSYAGFQNRTSAQREFDLKLQV